MRTITFDSLDDFSDFEDAIYYGYKLSVFSCHYTMMFFGSEKDTLNQIVKAHLLVLMDEKIKKRDKYAKEKEKLISEIITTMNKAIYSYQESRGHYSHNWTFEEMVPSFECSFSPKTEKWKIKFPAKYLNVINETLSFTRKIISGSGDEFIKAIQDSQNFTNRGIEIMKVLEPYRKIGKFHERIFALADQKLGEKK